MPTYLMQARHANEVDPFASESYRIDQTTGLIDDSIDESMAAAPNERRPVPLQKSGVMSALTSTALLLIGPLLVLGSVFVRGDDSVDR